MRKAIAVPYVIALILGVAVIALIGIWFVMSGGKFTKQASETQCESKIIEACSRAISTNSDQTTPAECTNVPNAIIPTVANCKTKLGL